jgi:hypothetical protein
MCGFGEGQARLRPDVAGLPARPEERGICPILTVSALGLIGVFRGEWGICPKAAIAARGRPAHAMKAETASPGPLIGVTDGLPEP